MKYLRKKPFIERVLQIRYSRDIYTYIKKLPKVIQVSYTHKNITQ